MKSIWLVSHTQNYQININQQHLFESNEIIAYICCYKIVKIMEQKKLVEQLIKAANEIYKNRKPSANYIQLSEEFI